MKKMPAMKAILLSSVLTLNISTAFGRDKIVGGEPVTSLAEVPFMVSLSGVCGGSIISSKWILTAAHCAGYFSAAKAGVLNLKDQGVSFKVKRTIKHPKYNASTMTHDYALVELEESIDLRRYNLRAVKLADKTFETNGYQDPGLDATVYGFGNLGSGIPNSSKTLNKVVVPIVSNEQANKPEAYGGEVDESMIAAGYERGGKDSCQGDSGGPMVVFDHRNDPVQVGVVSWGEGCAKPNKYGIYSKVSYVFDWIKSNISK